MDSYDIFEGCFDYVDNQELLFNINIGISKLDQDDIYSYNSVIINDTSVDSSAQVSEINRSTDTVIDYNENTLQLSSNPTIPQFDIASPKLVQNDQQQYQQQQIQPQMYYTNNYGLFGQPAQQPQQQNEYSYQSPFGPNNCNNNYGYNSTIVVDTTGIAASAYVNTTTTNTGAVNLDPSSYVIEDNGISKDVEPNSQDDEEDSNDDEIEIDEQIQEVPASQSNSKNFRLSYNSNGDCTKNNNNLTNKLSNPIYNKSYDDSDYDSDEESEYEYDEQDFQLPTSQIGGVVNKQSNPFASPLGRPTVSKLNDRFLDHMIISTSKEVYVTKEFQKSMEDAAQKVYNISFETSLFTNRYIRMNQGSHKKRNKIETTHIFKWLSENIDNPYPSKTEKVELAIKSNCPINAISTYFTNLRRGTNKKCILDQENIEKVKNGTYNLPSRVPASHGYQNEDAEPTTDPKPKTRAPRQPKTKAAPKPRAKRAIPATSMDSEASSTPSPAATKKSRSKVNSTDLIGMVTPSKSNKVTKK